MTADMRLTMVLPSRRKASVFVLALIILANVRTIVFRNNFDESNSYADRRGLSSAVVLPFPNPDHIKGGKIVPMRLHHEVEHQANRKLANMRIACFGYTDTWAVTTFDTSIRPKSQATDGHSMDYFIQRFDFDHSYCRQLGPNVDNYGFPAQGPNYASTCLQTMIQDNVYDVIVIDFPLNRPEVVEPLTERLRIRFPKAGIFVIDRLLMKRVKLQDSFYPSRQSDFQNVISKFAGGKRKRFWEPASVSSMDRDALKALIAERKEKKKEREEFKNEFEKNPKKDRRGKIIKPKKEHWTEMVMGYKSFKEGTEEIHKKFRTNTVNLGDEENLEDSLIEVIDYYYDDGVTLTQAGHDYLAQTIKEAIASTNIGSPVPVHAPFGGGDYCDVWFTTGETSFVRMGTGATMVNYQDIRYGIEFASKDAFIEITNPFKTKRTVYVSYLTSPGPDQIYNSAIVNVDGSSTRLDTIGSDEYQSQHSITTAKTVPLGRISHGTHNLKVEDLGNAIRPFRIVGVSITDELHVPTDYDFTQVFWYKGLNVLNRGGVNEYWL